MNYKDWMIENATLGRSLEEQEEAARKWYAEQAAAQAETERQMHRQRAREFGVDLESGGGRDDDDASASGA